MPTPRIFATPEDAYEEALRRIGDCRLMGKDGTGLNLAGLGLTQLPAEIGQLSALTMLILSGNDLKSLPPEIGKLRALTVLRLENNEVASLPPEFVRLKELAELSLRGNLLTAVPPEIFQLPALTELHLHDNRLTSLPRAIGQLGTLKVLRLEENQLSFLPPEFGLLTALTHLRLHKNRLEELPAEIGHLAAVVELRLEGNRLSRLPPQIGGMAAVVELRLEGNRLSCLPPELGRLTALEELDLDGNLLTCLPGEIGQLTALSQLDLDNNLLESLPPEIGQLRALRQLYLSGNPLSNLPPEIGQLAELRLLNLSRCRLTVLPREIAKLSFLKGLYLAGNRFSRLPAEMEQLSALTELSLVDNDLQTLPPGLKHLHRLERLYLHGNPALELSPAILGGDPRVDPTSSHASAQSILDYYFARRTEATRPLDEVKVILVGRGGAGKTSTARALRGLPHDVREGSTPGIALSDWVMEGCQGGSVTAHMWDFAGQVITHALHQFFFSVRSVYLLVLSGRENHEREDAEYWLRLIQAFGTDETGQGPPVIVVLNKWEVEGCRPRVDRGALQERYPFIREFIATDCHTGHGIAQLKSALCRAVDELKWVREPFPLTWDAVRMTLMRGRETKPHMPYAEFRRLCAEHGVTDPRKQDSLSEILHNLGAALNYRNDPRLREATVLQPEWLTAHVYALMRGAEKAAGVLHQADADDILAAEPEMSMREYLMQVMERFEIAYATKSPSKVWLVPQALPDEQPLGLTVFRDAVDVTRLRYSYAALPEGLVARAIVRLHEFIDEDANGHKLQWASGAVLTREGARALVRSEPPGVVMITVIGPPHARQQLAGLCRDEMRDIHAEVPGLDPIEETQYQGAWVGTVILELDEKNQRKTGLAIRHCGTVDIDPAEPNNAFSNKASRSDGVWKPRVFISYSKTNVAQRRRLESELKILKNEGLLAGHWHDRMIAPGQDWDGVIQNQIDDADVLIVLVSSAALATDYITEHEIPKAMERHREGKVAVVPLILEDCRWQGTPLSGLHGLPEKARPLNTWRPTSKAWKCVADGLAQVCEKLMTERGR